MSALMDQITTLGFGAGWAVVKRMPDRTANATFERLADASWARRGPSVQRLESNIRRVVGPDVTEAELRVLSKQAMRSYLRYWCDAFRLPGWSRERIVESISVIDDHHLADGLATGRGVVVALPHMGNWDHAGAWATLAHSHVVTVAERLKPEAVFEEFLEFRTSLGMTIIPLATDSFARLRTETAGPVVVPLLADRDLTGGGLSVDFCGHEARMAPGPAALALATRSALHPVSIRHERRGSGWGIVITFHDEVAAPVSGATRAKTQAMTGECARVLGEAVTRHTSDWHMLQRVFVADLQERG